MAPRRRTPELVGGGTIKIPKGEVGRLAAKLLEKFSKCGTAPNGEQLLMPPPDYVDSCTRTAIAVCSMPVEAGWASKGDLVVGGSYSRRTHTVTMHVERACVTRSDWMRRMLPVLRHELTHSRDPYVRVRRKPYARFSQDVDLCKYFQDPVEVAAFLAESEQELLSSPVRQRIAWERRKGYLERPEDILMESQTFLRMRNCMTPKIHRRFLQMAARLWSSGKLGPLPRAAEPNPFLR